MKKIVLVIALLGLVGCDIFKSSQEKLFDLKDLSRLELENIDNFWDTDSLEYDDNLYFDYFSSYMGGIELKGMKKRIVVSVFKSQRSAIRAMEGRRNMVAAVIVAGGKHELIKGKWWFTDNIPNGVFVNQWNTIVEVSYYHTDFEQIIAMLIVTAAEIARRIDSLSHEYFSF